MTIRCDFFLAILKRQFIFIGLLSIFLSSSLVFAQDSDRSIGTKIDPEYLILITSSNSLNVRQQPTILSPVVGSLPSGSKVSLIKSEDKENKTVGKANWYQVEYTQGKFGWVSKDYSRKIKTPANKPTSHKFGSLESKSQAPIEEVKPVAEAKVDSTQVESQGIFKGLFSSKTQKSDKKTSQNTKVGREKKWANIAGFRSAKFGMQMQEVRKAIYQDFGIQGEKITSIKHPKELTQTLAVTVKNLLPNSGNSQISYVFGFQSKRLILVNMLTGHPADASLSSQQVVSSGNFLGNHLLRKRYQDDGLVAHAKLNDGSVLIFRGKDPKGRMVLLRLSAPQSDNKDNEGLKIGLSLSYIEKPGQPDIYQLKEGDF